MLTVHHLGVSQSERIVWLCEELGIAYELKRYARDPATRMAPPEYKALHKLGTAPIITDGEVTLPESGAIIEYIIAKHGGGRLAVGPDEPNFADYLFWFHFANGSMMPSQMSGMMIRVLGLGADHPIVGIMNARSDNAWAMVESRLGEADYFAGDAFTAADVIMVFALTTMRGLGGPDLADFPNVRAYLKRIGARPAYQRAMAKGDPDMTPMLS